jgi:hypothetical protein
VSAGELECLSVLWEAVRPLKLKQIFERISQRRADARQGPVAQSTVSGYLRQLVAKGLLTEVTIDRADQEGEESRTFVRGGRGMIPTSRSPKTGYQTAYEPGEVLGQTFQALAESYPEKDRARSLIDFASNLKLSAEERKTILVELAKKFDLPTEERQQTLVLLAQAYGLDEKRIKKLERILEDK